MRLSRNDPTKVWASVFRDRVPFQYGKNVRGARGPAVTVGDLQREYLPHVRRAEYVAYVGQTPIAWYGPLREGSDVMAWSVTPDPMLGGQHGTTRRLIVNAISSLGEVHVDA
jgi:hypothetical protein